jgi:uncharacterized MAPEG superfamily protein
MTFSFWCVLAAALLPYFTVIVGKRDRTYDNHAPRDWALTLEGRKRRAIAAHHNHFEAFAPFAAAVIMARIAQAPMDIVNALAAAFIVLRLGYTWAYLSDRPGLRSLLWGLGFACVVAIFAIAAAR